MSHHEISGVTQNYLTHLGSLPCLHSPNKFKLRQLQSGLMWQSTCCMSLQIHLRACCECVCFKKPGYQEPKLNHTKQILLHESSVYQNIFLLAERYCKLSFISLACKISATIRHPLNPPLHALCKTKCILLMVLLSEFIEFMLSLKSLTEEIATSRVGVDLQILHCIWKCQG